MWECTFIQYCKQRPAIYTFIDSRRPGFFQNNKGTINESLILDWVNSGRLFGMVEVDIEVPMQWPSHFNRPSMTPYDYFQEMSPLFCTCNIPYNVIDYMKEHVNTYNLSITPRRLLVGGMKDKQILIATPYFDGT